jgi:hypothetical protein
MRVKLSARCPYTPGDLIGHYDPQSALYVCAKCDGSQEVITNKNARRSAIFSKSVGGTDFLSEAANRKQHDQKCHGCIIIIRLSKSKAPKTTSAA